MSNAPECLVCGFTYNLHKHHIFEGNGRRQLSEKWGCWCYLCAKHHNMSKGGVHFNNLLEKRLKQMCQRKWEEQNGSREEFIKIFGRNYLD